MTNTFVRLKNASVRYGATVGAEDISFDICAGDFICLAGCNGSGKTSVVRAVLRLVPLSSGEIIRSLEGGEISYVPQIGAVKSDFPATNFEIVLSGRQKRRRLFFSKEDRQAAADAMKILSVDALKDKPYSTLSGGQKQRVLIARAVCSAARLLILDEPVNTLDGEGEEALYRHLHEAARMGRAVLIVTHHLSAVKKYATKIGVMNKRLEFFGTCAEWEKYRSGGRGVHYDE